MLYLYRRVCCKYNVHSFNFDGIQLKHLFRKAHSYYLFLVTWAKLIIALYASCIVWIVHKRHKETQIKIKKKNKNIAQHGRNSKNILNLIELFLWCLTISNLWFVCIVFCRSKRAHIIFDHKKNTQVTSKQIILNKLEKNILFFLQ